MAMNLKTCRCRCWQPGCKQEPLSDELVRFIKSEVLVRTAKHSETARALDPRPHLKLDSV